MSAHLGNSIFLLKIVAEYDLLAGLMGTRDMYENLVVSAYLYYWHRLGAPFSVPVQSGEPTTPDRSAGSATGTGERAVCRRAAASRLAVSIWPVGDVRREVKASRPAAS